MNIYVSIDNISHRQLSLTIGEILRQIIELVIDGCLILDRSTC